MLLKAIGLVVMVHSAFLIIVSWLAQFSSCIMLIFSWWFRYSNSTLFLVNVVSPY